uniref:Uncharacterized protein n=1 Tax=Ditylenchus dipsaci TaxID=166011 RepID=A0A915CPC8_9BILA
MADYPGQAHHQQQQQQQHLSHHQQQQQQHYEQMRQQQQYTLQQQQHSMAAMQHAQSQHMQQIMQQQQQQHQQSPQMLARPMNTTNTSPPNMGQRPAGHPQMQQHNNLLHQQVQQQSRQISNSPQHMLHQQQSSHLTRLPLLIQQQQQYSQGNPGQMVRQPQYIQFARPGTSVYSNQAAGGGLNPAQGNVLHQPQPLPKQLQKPAATLGPQRVLTQQPIQYRAQPVGVGRSQPVRYAYIQSDGSVQPINQESDRPVQIVSQLHPMQLQYQQGPAMGQQPQGSALRQALVQDGRHPNGIIAQQRPMVQSSMANMTPHNVVLVSANGQQQALNLWFLDSTSANIVNNQGDSSVRLLLKLDLKAHNRDHLAESSPPDSNPNQLSKPSITARNRPKSKSPSKMGVAGPSGKPMALE